jgi:hypothetical protein
MSRRVIAAAVLATAGLAGSGCGGGTPVDQPRRVSAFDELLVTGGVKVEIARGSRAGVTVHGGENVLDRVVTESAGSRLHVGIRDRGVVIGADPLGSVRVRVTVPSLRAVAVHGHGDVSLGSVTTQALRLTIDGAGHVSARGRVDTLVAVIHGAGDVNLGALSARAARVEIHGAGHVDVDVAEELDVQVRGAGEVSYRGSPVVRRDIRGAGEVIRAAS